MKPWSDLKNEAPELAKVGKRLLLPSRPHVGYAFIATLRKDGAPRLHPVSIVMYTDHVFVMIPAHSPKCADLLRDGRCALQAFPPAPNDDGEEFYISGFAQQIHAPEIRQSLIQDTQVFVDEDEVLFEVLLERVMYTRLVERGTPGEHPLYVTWRE